MCSETQGWPCSYDGSGQGACSGDWTAGVIADQVTIFFSFDCLRSAVATMHNLCVLFMLGGHTKGLEKNTQVVHGCYC